MAESSNKRAIAQLGNRNAAKAEPRKMVSIRLPADLIAQLIAHGDKTAAIEQALRQFFKNEKH